MKQTKPHWQSCSSLRNGLALLLFLALNALVLPVDAQESVSLLRSRNLSGSNNNTAISYGFRKQIAESCNGRNPCAEGLECMPAPTVVGILIPRKVCLPYYCLATAVKTFNEKVNLTAYRDMIFATSEVTPTEFFLNDQPPQASWGAGEWDTSSSRKPLTSWGVAKQMLQSRKTHRVMKTIEQNPIPQDTWKQYESDLAACDPNHALSKRDRLGLGPTEPGVQGTVGFGADVGAALGGGIDFFFSYPEGPPNFYITLAGGLMFGADAGGTVSAGVVFTGFPGDIPGVGFELDLQIPTPIVGPGVSIGVDINNVWALSFVVGVGVGLTVGGFTAGYTWGFPENTTAFL